MLPNPYDALKAAENALRLIIRQQLDDAWLSDVDQNELEKRRREEAARRDGAQVEQDLLYYTHLYQLDKIIRKYWNPHFVDVFKDKKRTEVWLAVLKDVRDPIGRKTFGTQSVTPEICCPSNTTWSPEPPASCATRYRGTAP